MWTDHGAVSRRHFVPLLLLMCISFKLIRNSSSLAVRGGGGGGAPSPVLTTTSEEIGDTVEKDNNDNSHKNTADDDDDDDEDDNDMRLISEEEVEIGYTQSLIVKQPPIAQIQSLYQNIEIYHSHHYGKVLLLDDNLQLTENDASHYNEMMAHVPVMEYLSNCGDDTIPLRVLVIGGGDGYVVSELLRYPQIQHIDHVELDVHVINASKEHLHWGSYTWHDKRVNLIIENGAKFVQQQVYRHQYYHVIIQDAGDPFWYNTHGDITTLPSSILYTSSHFINLHKLLQPKGGVLMFQAETYNIPSNLHAVRKWRVQLQEIGFGNVRYGTVSIGTYSTGQLGFLTAHVGDGNEQQYRLEVCGSSTNENDSIPPCDDTKYTTTIITDPTMQTTTQQQQQAYRMDLWPEIKWLTIQSRYKQMTGKTRYYHPRIHRSSFDLPLWVEEYIYGDDDDDRGAHDIIVN